MGKHTITIDDTLYNDISEYCKLNNLKINAYCNELLKKEHNMSKFGDIPFGVFGNKDEDKIQENIIQEPEPVVISDEYVEVLEEKPTEIAVIKDKIEEKDIKPKKRRL